MGEFLRRFDRRALKALSTVNARLVAKLLSYTRQTNVTLDFDATLIESHKQEAVKTYEGFDGYDPLLCFIPEARLVLRGLFRPGNASPASHALSFLRGCLKLLPGSVTRIRIRSDSAWYNHKVMDFCHDRGILFGITADRHSALKEVLKAIPPQQWLPFDQTNEIAETVHVVGKSPRAYRLVALRTLAQQPDLFGGAYLYKVVITNIDDWSPQRLIAWHRKRADAENIIKEVKQHLGLRRLPCGDLLPNAAFFHIALLSYNLVQAFKLLALPHGWFPLTLKTLRYRLLHMPGIVTQHARNLVLKLPSDHPYRHAFSSAGYRIIGIAAEF